LRRRHIGEPGRVGMDPSRHHSPEDWKYLFRSDSFHQSDLPVIKRHAILALNELFIRFGSLMAKPPLL
jgi:hypothetical protein